MLKLFPLVCFLHAHERRLLGTVSAPNQSTCTAVPRFGKGRLDLERSATCRDAPWSPEAARQVVHDGLIIEVGYSVPSRIREKYGRHT